MKYKEKQEKYKPKILSLLKNKEHGMIATEIKEEINHELSRNTIQSYLDQLEAEKKVHSVKIGRYELWFHSKQKDRKIEVGQNMANHPIFHFLISFLEQLQNSSAKEAINWKQLGIDITESFGFEPYFPNLRYFTEKDQLEIFKVSKEIYPSILRQVLIFLGDENFEIEPPIVQKQIHNIVFRIRGSKYSDNTIFFKILAGIEEAEISKMMKFPVKVEVLQQITDKKIVDLNLNFPTIKENKNS